MTTQTIKARFQPYQMRHKVTFNSQTEKENAIGQTVTVNSPLFTKHYAKVKISINQKFSAVGTEAEHDVYIAVKHDKRFDEMDYAKLTATIGNDDYRIVDIDVVDDNYLSYDMITLRKVSGHSGT